MRVIFFEDQHADDLGPIALLRPVFELLCGHFCVRERVIRILPVDEWGAVLRDQLAESFREQHPEARVNDLLWSGTAPALWINGRWIADSQELKRIDPASAGIINGTVAYVAVDPSEAPLFDSGRFEEALYQIARLRPRREVSGRLIARPWDLVEWNSRQIEEDFRARLWNAGTAHESSSLSLLGDPANLHLDSAAEIEPYVVMDVRQGPISIEAGAIIQAFTRLEGPCHIGRESQLFRANVRRGTTIGPICRVGGEIESSILHGYVNKYHEGFLGHSYVCPWVNLGALTTNSDLKNDYSSVKVPLAGHMIDSGLTKAGCYIGDHTKTGLGTLFNTGSSIGVMCMILPSGELLPKHVPSFGTVWHGELTDAMPLERSLAAARHAMERRNCELTPAQQRLLRWTWDQSAREREAAIARDREKRSGRAASSA